MRQIDSIIRYQTMLAHHWRSVQQMIGLILLSFIMAELIARAILWVHDLQPDYRTQSDAYTDPSWVEQYFREDSRANIEWHSYVYWRHQPFSGAYIHVGREGLRRTFNVANPDAPRQIYFFGGSTLWGTGARDDFTIPSLVSKQLIEAGCQDVYVTNFGEIGYVNTQEVLALTLALRQSQAPTIVVFYDGINDTLTAYQNGAAGLPLNESNRREEFVGKNWPLMALKRLALYRLAEIVARRVAAVTPTSPPLKEELATDVLTTYSANIRLIHSLAAEYGFVPYYFWQPVVYSKPQLSQWEQSQVQKGAFGMDEFFGQVYSALHQSDLVQRENNVYDISNAFDHISDTIFIDTWHTAERGNEIVADIIADVLGEPLGCPQ